MATPHYAQAPHHQTTSSGGAPFGSEQSWQESSPNYRSVTPAMKNTRGAPTTGRMAPSPGRLRVGASPSARDVQRNSYTDPGRSSTPSRYTGHFDAIAAASNNNQSNAATATSLGGNSLPTPNGLIRLTLRKPMGIVFEPMYDPNNPSVQRGVRICDLPRTGAAALSRKLEIGDELLSINDKTMSRLTFDEIMDFIIEADPEEVRLLFRRQRKEVLNARHGIKAPKENTSGAGVKWVDDEEREKKASKEKSDKRDSSKKSSSSRRKSSSAREDDETFQSDDQESSSRRYRRKGRGRKDPYETESFLDLLIDTICANPDNICRERRRRDDDDYYSDEDDGTFASQDDSTYVTYESEETGAKKKYLQKLKNKSSQREKDESTYAETEDETLEESRRRKEKKHLSPVRDTKKKESAKPSAYDDDGTLETVDSVERAKQQPDQAPPLGLAPHPNPEPVNLLHRGVSDQDDDGNPAPIKEVEYDDQGADVSVMESLGGPSLLIEKQRQSSAAARELARAPEVPREIIDEYGQDYPCEYGQSLEKTVQNDPLRFYTFVVKTLLEEHEPEKVRLLDKLLAKYKGREDHLIQKLAVRYNKDDEEEAPAQEAFNEAVNKGKASEYATAHIEQAKQRMQAEDAGFAPAAWPEKETKEAEPEDHPRGAEEGDEESLSGSEDYSSDSIDGTSPTVIAQVSELLNYVYGKTSVPGQIDRVSTIMRAYEGREAVLLELLETKALIKANREKENAEDLPSFLRNSVAAQRNLESEGIANGMNSAPSDVPPVTPMATQPPQESINDDISSMSGVSTPAGQQMMGDSVLKQISHLHGPHSASKTPRLDPGGFSVDDQPISPSSSSVTRPERRSPSTVTLDSKAHEKKKKKGIFGGLFGKKAKNKTKTRGATK